MWSVFILLIEAGSRLKIRAPFTARDDSLAFFTEVGADLAAVFGMMYLPLLSYPGQW